MASNPKPKQFKAQPLDVAAAAAVEQRLLANAEKYRTLKKTGAPMKPVGISIAVTGRCNSHCIMCSIWKLGHDDPNLIKKEMTRQEILDCLRDPYLSDLVEIDLTGGEPHLRDDLAEIVFDIIELKASALTKLRTIIIPSNGFLTDVILARTKRILARLEGTGIDFVPVASLDGMGPSHDTMRGTAGAFDRQMQTLAGYVQLRERYPDFFFPGIKTTITHHNVTELDELLDFALKRRLFHIISAVIISKKRFRNEQFRDQLALTSDDLKKITSFYDNRHMDLDFYYQKIFESIASGKKQWTCTALFNYFFIDYDRKLYPCPIQDLCAGDLTAATITEVLNSEQAARIRRTVGTYPLCRQCTEPGTVRYSQVLEGRTMLAFITAKGRQFYPQMIFDQGLHKLLYL